MPPRSPNILFITCHDLGRFLGCYGVQTVHTPVLDGLAADGVLFNQAYATAPQCSPSRSSLFTGRYPHSNGVLGLTHGEFGWDLHPQERHVAQILGDAGYATAMIGILHEAREIERCGFHEVILPGHDARETTERAEDLLNAFAGKSTPFYLQLGYHEPHRVPACTPHDADFLGFSGYYIEPDDSRGVTIPPFIRDDEGARAEIAELQGAVQHLDRAIGGVLHALRDLDLERDTLVIFTTDHGLALPRSKCSLYDPGTGVAMMLRLPARGWTGGRHIDQLVSNVDIFPTMLEVANLPAKEDVQGRSLVPLLDGRNERHRDCVFGQITYHDYYHPQRSIRTERHKLIVSFTTAPFFMDPSQSWVRRVRPVHPEEPALAYAPPVELYDLREDPNEWHNLADDDAHLEIRKDLLERLFRWMRDTGDPLLDGAVTSPRHRSVVSMLSGTTNGDD
jgi:N-sulfoglucosamine sulfohydrolase